MSSGSSCYWDITDSSETEDGEEDSWKKTCMWCVCVWCVCVCVCVCVCTVCVCVCVCACACVQLQTDRGPGNRCVMNIHVGASGWNSCQREKQAAERRSIATCVGPQPGTHTHTHTHSWLQQVEGNLSVCLLQATDGDEQQQGSSVANMWRRRSEVTTRRQLRVMDGCRTVSWCVSVQTELRFDHIWTCSAAVPLMSTRWCSDKLYWSSLKWTGKTVSLCGFSQTRTTLNLVYLLQFLIMYFMYFLKFAIFIL